jgi:RHS repeat-associated protein
VRYATEGVPTKYQYTGQYSYEAEFGLYFYNARWYDPVLNRFAQADTVIPSGVQGYDRYAYVNNNPLRYIDPSGHIPTDPPWKISLVVNLATSGIPTNYWNPAAYPSEAQANYAANQQLPEGHFNLCGDISLSMILESSTGDTDTLYDIYSASPSSRGWNRPTGSYSVGQQFAGSFPTGWSAISVTYGEVARFKAGDQSEISYVSNSPAGASSITSANALAMRFADMLASGHYVIAGVTQLKSDPSGGVPGLVNNGTDNSVGHWVVVTGVSDNHVFINNPYTNRKERYTWKQFYGSWRHSWIQLIPPQNRHSDSP